MPLPKAIAEFMQKYGVTTDEVWAVPGGKAYAVKHAALERIAYEHNIQFAEPRILEANGADAVVAMMVTAKMGDFSTWSIGEAAPKNNRNAYPWAMAEKRAKDRCILKLLNIHGTIYSEDEADDLKRQDKAPPDYQPISDAELASLIKLIAEANADLKRFTQYLQITELKDLPKSRFAEAIAALNAKKVRHVG